MNRDLAIRFALALVLTIVPVAAGAAGRSPEATPRARAGTLTPETVVDMRGVGDVAISPDGRTVAYVVSVPRSPKDKPGDAHQEIWLVPARGGTARGYTPAGQRAWAPAFAPDGERLALLSSRPAPGSSGARGGAERDASTGLYLLHVDGGEARLLTNRDVSVSRFRWSPDGRSIAYTAKDPETETERQDQEAGRDHVVVDRNLEPLRLWRLDVATGASERVTEGDAHVLEFDWSPDGTRFVLRLTDVPRVDEDYLYSRLAFVPASGGEPASFAPTQGKLARPLYSPAGGHVAWLGATDLNDPFAGSVFVASTLDAAPVEITRGQAGCATDLAWLDDETLVVARTRGTATVLELQPQRGGAPRAATAAGPVFTEFDLTSRGRQVALAASTPACPNEVHTTTLGGGAARWRRLTTTNPEIESVQLGHQEVLRWRAADGLEIEGILVQPLGFAADRTHPLVVLVHGGPEACYRNGWVTSYGAASQVLAARGFVVLLPNYRGSIGRDEAFERGDHGDLMGAEFSDILAGIDALVQRGWVDAARVGIAGGSYGGYTAAWAATAHSQRFAAAVDFAGITNWLSMQGTSDIPEENALVHWNRPFYENTDLYWERSPLAHVKNCRTPLLVLHGEKDARVPIGQGQEIYTALRLLGREVEFVRYPRAGHGLRERAHQLDMLERSLGWFDRFLKPAAGGVSSRR